MSAEEKDALEGWAASLGGTIPTSTETHTTSQQGNQSDKETTKSEGRAHRRQLLNQKATMTRVHPNFDDDPEDWLDPIWMRQRIGSMTGEIRRTSTSVPIKGVAMLQ